MSTTAGGQRLTALAGPARLTVADELSCYYDTAAEPNNVHLEARPATRLDEQALRAAVLRVLAAHPRARARLVPGRPWQRPAWEFPPHPEAAVLRSASWADEDELACIREQFLGQAPSLRSSPPVTFLLATGPDEDVVLLKANHAALDGMSCLTLLRDVARCYRGLPVAAEPTLAGDHAPAVDELRDGAAVSQPGASGRPRAAPSPAGARHSPGRRPRRAARIAGQRAAAHRRPERGTDGYGVVLTQAAVPLPARPSAATVNDVMIAALIVAISRWNAARGAEHGLIRITVPIDARPAGQARATGNLSRLSAVSALPVTEASGLRRLLDAVAAQTVTAKQDAGPQVGGMHRLLAGLPAPAAAKKRLVRAGLRLAGPLVCDTSLLSNLGRVSDPPAFGPGEAARLWFSTSAHMPRGLSVGAVTVGDTLQLCFRYRRALFDPAAANAFAACFEQAVAALCGLQDRKVTTDQASTEGTVHAAGVIAAADTRLPHRQARADVLRRPGNAL
ncbi:MAG TPA: hypothetical protein VGI64_02345 [Streptosporangiaceae bacterium]|jgi:NRPS condensation-like uncharacterized protein